MNKEHEFEKVLWSLSERITNENGFAQVIYAALCNTIWKRVGDNSSNCYGCSWRYAGGLIASIRNKGEDYLDFYCSGNEGRVRDDVKQIFAELGWLPYDYK